MGRHYYLEPVTPQFPRKLDSDSMRLVRRHLARLEALVGMIRYIASGLAESELGRVELVTRTLNTAVDPGRVIELLGLIFVRRMFVKTTLRFSANRLRQTV